MNDGGPAFPNADPLGGVPAHTLGMSLRDYFAAAAMQRILGEFREERFDVLAAKAYAVADAMLQERNNDRANQQQDLRGVPESSTL